VMDLLTSIKKEQRRSIDNGDESSSSSFYSSFLYKSSNSSCNLDQKMYEGSSEVENQTGQIKDVRKTVQSFVCLPNVSYMLPLSPRIYPHIYERDMINL